METSWIKRTLALLSVMAFVAVLAFVPLCLYADALYREAFGPGAKADQAEAAYVTKFSLLAQENEHQTQSRISGWLSVVSSQEAAVSCGRGTLRATQYEPVGGAADAPWAIVFHGGLGTDRTQVLDIACALSVQGYRVLTPDLFAHGGSEGDAATLGFGDAQDVFAWIDYVQKTQAGARIVLFGQDEGAAAVLSAACAEMSDAVCAVAADSAFDDGETKMLSLAGETQGGMRALMLKAIFRRRTGGTVQALSSRIHQAKTPLLLIHGTGDQEVMAWQSEDIAAAAGENAKLLFIEGAGHGLSRFVDPQAYYEELLAFFDDAVN